MNRMKMERDYFFLKSRDYASVIGYVCDKYSGKDDEIERIKAHYKIKEEHHVFDVEYWKDRATKLQCENIYLYKENRSLKNQLYVNKTL